jgi:hypothetical protein
MGASVGEVSAQAVPVQKKWGLAAFPDPLAEMNPAPVPVSDAGRLRNVEANVQAVQLESRRWPLSPQSHATKTSMHGFPLFRAPRPRGRRIEGLTN